MYRDDAIRSLEEFEKAPSMASALVKIHAKRMLQRLSEYNHDVAPESELRWRVQRAAEMHHINDALRRFNEFTTCTAQHYPFVVRNEAAHILRAFRAAGVRLHKNDWHYTAIRETLIARVQSGPKHPKWAHAYRRGPGIRKAEAA